MPLLIIVLLCLGAAYAVLMLCYRYGWDHSKEVSPSLSDNELPGISVIIPARNEARNISACLASVLNQDYPKERFEVIVVDDDSEDETAALASSFVGIKLISLHKETEKGFVAHKKRALSKGIAQSSFDIIITTDADCIAPEGWLRSIAAQFIRGNKVMIAGPVTYSKSNSLLSVFQSLDFMTMQGITAATLKLKWGSMANGANLAFRKPAFEEVKGYEGVSNLASGDDFLLMNKMRKRFGDQLGYLRNTKAIVTTAPQPDWKSFLNQRIRWASKSGKYDDKITTIILSLVYIFNLCLLLACMFLWHQWKMILLILAIKIISEMILLWPVAGFFKKRHELAWFPFLQPLHMLYVVIAGFLGMIGNYSWKGRSVR